MCAYKPVISCCICFSRDRLSFYAELRIIFSSIMLLRIIHCNGWNIYWIFARNFRLFYLNMQIQISQYVHVSVIIGNVARFSNPFFITFTHLGPHFNFVDNFLSIWYHIFANRSQFRNQQHMAVVMRILFFRLAFNYKETMPMKLNPIFEYMLVVTHFLIMFSLLPTSIHCIQHA